MLLHLFFLLIAVCGFCEEPPKAPLLASIESEPSSIIDGCINVVSGSFFEHEVDLVVPGPEPLKVERLLVNNNTRPSMGGLTSMHPEWKFNDVQFFSVNKNPTEEQDYTHYRNRYHGALGESLFFHYKTHVSETPVGNECSIDLSLLKHGHTNTSQRVVGGQTNIRNNLYKNKDAWIELRKSDGSSLRFGAIQGRQVTYLLQEEICLNYLKKNCTYREGYELCEYSLKNWGDRTLSSLARQDVDAGLFREITYKAPDGRSALYRYVKEAPESTPYVGFMRNRLHEVIRSDKPNILYVYAIPRIETVQYPNYPGYKSYHVHGQMIGRYYPENRYIGMEYYIKESINASYESKKTLQWITRDEATRLEEVEYEVDNAGAEFGRIKRLTAPLGSDASPLQKYRFEYCLNSAGGGCTGVYDARNCKTDYSYNNRGRLRNVVKYHKSGAAYTIENLTWGPEDTHKEIELSTRTFGVFGSPYKTFSKVYDYDIAGNVIHEFFAGNLTGKSETNTLMVDANGIMLPGTADCLIKSHEYTQDQYHLLTKTTVGTKSTRNVFIPNTNLLAACYHADKGITYLRHFYFYNDTGMVIKHLIDDGINDDVNDLTGVTERKIERIERTDTYPVGYPLVVTELCLDLKTGQEQLIGRKVNTYDKSGRLIQEDVHGNDGQLAFSNSWEYDAHGNVTKEVRPDGAVTLRSYDANDNMISETGPNPLLTKTFTYDFMNRLIQVEEHHPDMLLTKHFRYDVCGNLLAKVDAMGNETRTHYDDFNRPILVEGGEIADENGQLYRPVTQYQYNELSQPTKIIAPDGSVTEFAYTIYGKPCKIAYPDGSIERFEYDLEGKLVKEVAKNGSIALHTYDAQNRIIKTVQLTASGEEAYQTTSKYNTFHLLEKTDPEGNVTSYHYDCYGRLTSETKGEYVTSYEYDTLNRNCKTIIGDSVKSVVINYMGQVIEERTENSHGDVLALVRFSYDVEGNKIRIEQDSEAGLIVATQTIDTHGIPLESVDPEGNVTRTRLYLDYFNSNGQRVVRVETTDPLGITTVIIKDTQGHTAEQIKLNPYGEEIQKTAYIYNPSGKCIRTIEKVFRGEESAPDVINAWYYNSVDQLICMTQALGQPEEKKVTYNYNSLGQLESTMKPDGVSLQFFYDGLGRLLEEKADDHSVHHRYTYDIRSNPIEVENLVNHTMTSRQYDEHNRVTLEKLANGLEMQIAYNADGGINKVTLPDSSSIRYTYKGPLLTKVERKTSTGDTRYQHTYDDYDLSGNPLKASLIHNLGELTSRYTLKGQPKEQKTSYYQENLDYDPMNNIIKKSYEDAIGKESSQYTYDSLRQMTGESGYFNHQYTSDSLYNRSSKDGNKYTLNSLNCILSDGDAHYTYDACGNITSYNKNGKAYSFTYDALDRLTTLKIDSTTYTYTYDEQNRCITRQVASSETTSEKILFIGQCDIGTTDQNNQIKNLRVTGKGKGAEIGAAIAIELNGEVFAPIHDHQGSLIALIDASGKTRESCRYSAFGEEIIFDSSGNQISDSQNPWRFSSKRKEADFNLFGRRFYNPDLGRWLTPDPAGHEAGPNLYAYVSNSPLSHIDLFGFLEEEERGFSFASLRDSFRDAWSSCKDFISRSFERVKDSVSSLGREISSIGHEIPIPVVRDVVRVVGHALEKGTLAGFEFSHTLNKSELITHDGGPSDNDHISYVIINGIRTTREEAQRMMDEIIGLNALCKINLAYNGTIGGLGDLIESAVNKLGLNSSAINSAVDALRSAINQVGGAGSAGVVKVDAHSQGGIILALAMTHLTAEERSMLCVSTYGAATLIKPEGLKSCVNYVNEKDWVPLLGAPIDYAAAKMGLRPDVIFLKSLDPEDQHGYFTNTYTTARAEDMEKFQNRYCR